MINEATTRHKVRNSEYPKVMIHWRKASSLSEPTFTGPDMWQGDATVWLKQDVKGDTSFVIALGQSHPLGWINCSINPVECGALATASLPGSGLSERDLLWCGEWAIARMSKEILKEYQQYKGLSERF